MKNLNKTKDYDMGDKNYSWKGSPNAGVVLTVLAIFGAIGFIAVGFMG